MGLSPVANSFRRKESALVAEPFYPLHAYVCHSCFLVQVEEQISPSEIFTEYLYFSSYSDSYVKQAGEYTRQMIEKYKISANQLVIEIASNDGYLLRYFKERGVPVLGIEPAGNVAKVSLELGIPTMVEFFNTDLALKLVKNGIKADLLIGNHVLAQIPSLNDFVKGMKLLLKDEGVLTMEFPHLMNLMKLGQYDTIYHEHFSYFSIQTAVAIFRKQGLEIFHVEELPTHGGSVRIFVKHAENVTHLKTGSVEKLLEAERSAGLDQLEMYRFFNSKVEQSRLKIRAFFEKAKQDGKKMVGYGAPAKGNTLLNYCGIGKDMIDYTVDRNPVKQNCLLPGSHIPVVSPDKIFETKPDYLIIFPWNLREEIMETMSRVRSWGCQFVVLIPEPQVF